MTNQISTTFGIKFSDQVHVNGEQMKTRTRDWCEVVPMSMHDEAVETLEDIEAIEITGRHQKTQGQDIVHGRRRIRMREFRTTIYLDEKDDLSTLLSPRMHYAKAVARSMYRQFDRITVEAALASVNTGRDMTDVVTAANDGVEVVDATGGATYNKLLELSENFIDNEIGNELESEKCLLISGEEHTDLMQESSLTSGDFTRQFAIEKGRMVNAAGFDLIQFGGKVSNPMLKVSAGNVRSCIAMCKDAIRVGLAKDTEVNVDIRPDLNRAQQVQAVTMLGAVRKEGAMVQEFQTTHTP